MGAYVIRRVISGIAMLFVMTLVTFFLFFAAPVDAARLACGKNCQPEQIEQTRKALGYDKSWAQQWFDFNKGLVVGRQFPDDPELRKAAPQLVTDCPAPCLGYSTKSSSLVGDFIKERFPVSASLAIAAFILWFTFGVGLGIVAALFKGSWLDKLIVGLTLVAYAFPSFFIGQFLFKFVALRWGWWPYATYTPIAEGGFSLWAMNLLLPAVTLALLFMAGYVRMTRAFILETSSEDYLRTAKAKGLKRRPIVLKHTMRAALTPLLTMAGIDLASVLGGAVITESVFAYQGLGQLAAKSAVQWDLPMTIGIVVVLSTIVILANIIVDIAYAFIDPRVRLD